MSVWNPWHGCTRLSNGCKGCVVFRVDAAHGRNTELVRKTRAFDLPVRKDRNDQANHSLKFWGLQQFGADKGEKQ